MLIDQDGPPVSNIGRTSETRQSKAPHSDERTVRTIVVIGAALYCPRCVCDRGNCLALARVEICTHTNTGELSRNHLIAPARHRAAGPLTASGFMKIGRFGPCARIDETIGPASAISGPLPDERSAHPGKIRSDNGMQSPRNQQSARPR